MNRERERDGDFAKPTKRRQMDDLFRLLFITLTGGYETESLKRDSCRLWLCRRREKMKKVSWSSGRDSTSVVRSFRQDFLPAHHETSSLILGKKKERDMTMKNRSSE